MVIAQGRPVASTINDSAPLLKYKHTHTLSLATAIGAAPPLSLVCCLDGVPTVDLWQGPWNLPSPAFPSKPAPASFAWCMCVCVCLSVGLGARVGDTAHWRLCIMRVIDAVVLGCADVL